VRLELLDGATRERVLGYVREVGGVATHATGGVVRVTMPGWQAVVELATWLGLDAAEHSTEIVDLALRLATPAACLAWVQSHVEWRDEPGERLAYPTITLERQAGDCDDTASLLVAMFGSIGYPAVVCACTLDGVPVHGVCAVQLAAGWHWADATEPRDLRPWREHPLAGDARPGVRGVITPAPSLLRWP